MPNSNNEAEIEKKYREIKKHDGEKLRDHLEFFFDGVFAIIATIMLIEIPLPTKVAKFQDFLSDVFIFIICFLMIFFYWYQLHTSFALLRSMDKKLMALDVFYVAAVCIVPLMTKWVIMRQQRFPILAMGIVYLVVNILTFVVLYRSHALFSRENGFENLKRYIYLKRWFKILVLINVALIILTWFMPQLALFLYFLLPVMVLFIEKDD